VITDSKYVRVAEYVRDTPGVRLPDAARAAGVRVDTLRAAIREDRVPGIQVRPSDSPSDRAYRLWPTEDTPPVPLDPPSWSGETPVKRGSPGEDFDALLREYAELAAAVHAAQARMDAIKEEIKRCV